MKQLHFTPYTSGLTLIELLVALVIAAFLLLSTMAITARTIVAYDKEAEIVKMNEVARFTLDYISRRIRDSGYWGCMTNIEDINNNLDLGPTINLTNINEVLASFKHDINGESNIAIDMSPMSTSETPTSYAETSLDNSDILIVHNVDPRGNPISVIVPSSGTSSTTDVTVTTTESPLRLNVGDIVLIADCASGDIAQIANISTNTITFDTSTGSLYPGNKTAGLSTVYGDASYVYPLETHIFRIARGDSGLGLEEVSTQFPDGIELIENVERLKVLYGEDTDDNGSPNHYVKAEDVSDMNDVVSLHIEIVVVSDNDQMLPSPMTFDFDGKIAKPNDRRLRKVYSTTISRRNWI